MEPRLLEAALEEAIAESRMSHAEILRRSGVMKETLERLLNRDYAGSRLISVDKIAGALGRIPLAIIREDGQLEDLGEEGFLYG